MMLVVNSVTLPPANSTWYILVSNIGFLWDLPTTFPLASQLLVTTWPLAICFPLHSNLPPLAWAQALLQAGKITVCSVSHPHRDHTVGYFQALSLLISWNDPGTQSIIDSSQELFSGI